MARRVACVVHGEPWTGINGFGAYHAASRTRPGRLSSMLRRRVDAVEVAPGLWVGSAPRRHQVEQPASRDIDAVVDLRAENVAPDHP